MHHAPDRDGDRGEAPVPAREYTLPLEGTDAEPVLVVDDTMDVLTRVSFINDLFTAGFVHVAEDNLPTYTELRHVIGEILSREAIALAVFVTPTHLTRGASNILAHVRQPEHVTAGELAECAEGIAMATLHGVLVGLRKLLRLSLNREDNAAEKMQQHYTRALGVFSDLINEARSVNVADAENEAD